jgi:sporulation protein YlmC with PRC-barrel domain
MLCRLEDILGRKIEAVDGRIGSARDVYFDDDRWIVRYLVVDTGHWLPGRKVLISPESVRPPEAQEEALHVELTCEKIQQSPPIESDEPVSRQHQRDLAGHYLWTPYWDPVVMGGGGYVAGPFSARTRSDDQAKVRRARRDSHLRSADEVKGYHIRAADGRIGHVEDFVIQCDEWVIRYLLVDTRNFLGGRKVLVSPAWIRQVDWEEAEVTVEMETDEIASSPEWKGGAGPDRAYEKRLHEHYGKDTYWD